MKLERVEHPTPFGHPLNAILKRWSEPWLRDRPPWETGLVPRRFVPSR